MATVPVRVEFLCDDQNLVYTHNFPRTLISSDRPPASIPQYQATFLSTIKEIIPQHYAAALAACQTVCCICGSPKKQATVTPLSYLHLAEPMVLIFTTPICENPQCDVKARQQVQELMGKMKDMPGPKTSSALKVEETLEIKACRVCDKIEGAMKCARCGAVFYCGKEHQVADWPNHKLACKKAVKVGTA